MTELQSIARLTDPTFYADDPLPVYRRLREEAPVFWYEPGNFWALSKYEDVHRVLHSVPPFVSSRGVNLAAVNVGSEQITSLLTPENAENLILMDPPRHSRLRRLVSVAFTPKRVRDMEDEIRRTVSELVDNLPVDEELDFVYEVAEPIPLYVIGDLLGVGRDMRADLRRWTEAAMSVVDVLTEEQIAAVGADMQEMFAFLGAELAERHAKPRDDLMTGLTQAEFEGESLNVEQASWFCMSLLVGGNETTRNLISGSAHALSDHPDQAQMLRDDPSRFPGAVEELLRYVTPVITFARCAVEDVQIRDQTVREGEYVGLLLASANRDEEVWPDADRFDVTRPTKPTHLSFGFGEHLCLGANLARLEARVTFEELLSRFSSLTVTGEPERKPSTFVNGVERLPVTLSK